MYSPAEISRAYKLKTSIIFMIPTMILIGLLLYYPPKILVSLTGTTRGVQLQEIADSLQNAKLQLQRKNEILQNMQTQLERLQQQQNAISVIASDGMQLQIQKPQFQTWAEWSKANKGKSFSDFRTAENSYYKSQIDTIWSQLRKGQDNE